MTNRPNLTEEEREHYNKVAMTIINQTNDEDYESPYCEVCESCGEEGCCSVEKSILGHGCKYAQWYAKDVYFNEVLINELLTFIQDNVDNADNIVSKIYNTAFDKAKEKYEHK